MDRPDSVIKFKFLAACAIQISNENEIKTSAYDFKISETM